MAIDENGEWYDENQAFNGQGEDVVYGSSDSGGSNASQPKDTSGDGGSNGGGGNQDVGEGYFKEKLGDLYTPGAYEEYQHHDYDPGWADRIINKENLRADNEVGSTYHEDGSGGYLTGPQQAAQGGGGAKSSLLGGFGGGSGSGSSSSGNPKSDEIYSYLKGLFPGGGFNQDVVNRRLDSVRGNLDASRKSSQKNNEAYLADRGLIGDGPQATANENLESRLFGQFGSAYNDIYATESENADKRMISALQAATGMSVSEASQAIDQFRANTERDLGFGNLALGNKNADNSYALGQGNLALGNLNATNNYNLGAGNLSLNRDQLSHLIEQGDTDSMLEYLKILLGGAGQSANGYV